MKNNLFIKLLHACLLVSLLYTTQVSANEFRQAAIQTDAEFRSVIETVESTREWIDSANNMLANEDELMKYLDKDQQKQAKKLIGQMKQGLSNHSSQFELFGKTAKKVVNLLDMSQQADEMYQLYNQRKGGQLAKNLTLFNQFLEKTEVLNKVPVFGDLLTGYNKAVGDMLNATDKIAAKLDQERNDGMIGQGTYNENDNPKAQALSQQLGDSYLDHLWVPDGPSFVYSSDGVQGNLIWDEAAQSWYAVEGHIPVSATYYQAASVDKPLTPHQLKVYADKWEHVQQRQKDADRLYDYFDQLNRSLGSDNDALNNIDKDTFYAVRRLLKDKQAFRNNYTFNYDNFRLLRDAKQQVDTQLAALKTTASIRDILSKDEAPIVDEKAGSKGITCNSLSDKTLNLVQQRLAKASASEIASLSKQVQSGESHKSLLNCLCAETSKQASHVDKLYSPEPVNASPSCNDPANGSCVNLGAGCVRHQLVSTTKALQACHTAKMVAESICRQGL